MNVKLRLLSVGVLFFTGQALMAQKKTTVRPKTDTTTKTKEIEEVVIIGGVKLDPAQKVGSYNVVSKASFESTPFSNVDDVLNGRVAGLTFSSASGDPGSSNMVLVRGVSSLIGTPNPLYVIDGVVVGKGADNASLMESWNPLSSIDPNAIESVSVLKDASATALYGSRGANGVIIIKTKRGKYNQKTRLEFSSETGIQDRAFDNLKLMSGDEYIKYGGMLMWNSQGTNGIPVGAFTSLNDAIYNPTYGYLAKYEPEFKNNPTPYTDWEKAVNRSSSVVNTYNFGATGGGENTSFRIGGSYYQNKPLVNTSAFDRISINAAIDHKASEKLKFGLNINYSNVKRNTYFGGRASANPVTSSIMLSPLRPIYNSDGTYNQILGDGASTEGFNPVSILNNIDQISKINTFIGSANVDYQFAKNLYFNSLFGTQAQFMNETIHVLAGHPVYTIMSTIDPPKGFLGDYRTTIFDWNWSNTFSYRKVFAEKHNLETFIGMEYQNHTYNNISSQTYTLNDPRPYFNFADEVFTSNTDQEWTQISYFGRLNYTFDNKYTVTGQLRRDGNSTLGHQKWGNFWSVGGSWNVQNESFIPKIFSSAVLRASYGVLGNIPYADQWYNQYNMYALAGYNSNIGWGPNNGYGFIATAGNKDLKWEESKHFDIGADFGFFNERLKFTLDYYNKITDDAIFEIDTPSETGSPSSYYANAAKINNKGFELVIDATPISKGDFKWNINANAAYNRTVLDKFYYPIDIKTYESDTDDDSNELVALAPGHLLGEYYAIQWAGIAQQDDPAKGIKAGDALFYTDASRTDVTNIRNQAERVWMGKNAFPKYTVGITNDFKYKNWSLSFLITGQFDFYVQNGVRSYTIHYGAFPTRNQITDALYDSWTDAPGMENYSASNPKAVIGNPTGSRLESSRFIYKGDHLRLKELKISYSFGSLFKESVGINNLTVYLRGTNLLTYVFDKNLNFDPESNSNAWSWIGKGRYWYASPVLRTMSLGIQLGF
ncbi:SusC/RagA family TonB-linked outer membrane protein [Epilithonimonas mollis]|uniref:TonB-linked outer membrane protein, SusC/RagA family n=1 Tax=Epilithonimonas mollis TaxID=216903 RepID=A0A1M6R9Y3_9FLAO|nr:SusC/RagA family TonB-linked outer membrane protein [Epilithonimonas mollis]SHK29138.1 TonB-linked outer membrane protein, SusC/RagA family [Epilithonimonas mollis]